MVETLLFPFQFPAMQYAFGICVLLAVPTALLSCFVVLKGWALMGDAISHAVLPGIVIAYLLGMPLLIGAFGSGMLCALGAGYLTSHSRVKADTVMGVVFSGLFAFGIVLYVAIDTDIHLDHILFGNLLGISQAEIITAAVMSLVITVLILLRWKDLLLYIFDPTQAKAAGLPIYILEYGLLSALTLAIITTLNAAGLILAIGLFISPGATAFLITKRFSTMLIIAVILNLIVMTLGVYLSFFWDSAPAPTIIVLHSVCFVIIFGIKQWQCHRAKELI